MRYNVKNFGREIIFTDYLKGGFTAMIPILEIRIEWNPTYLHVVVHSGRTDIGNSQIMERADMQHGTAFIYGEDAL